MTVHTVIVRLFACLRVRTGWCLGLERRFYFIITDGEMPDQKIDRFDDGMHHVEIHQTRPLR